jgi:alkylhydroperoxidase family enzyme
MLEPFRAMGHNMPVARAYSHLERRASRWRRLDVKIKGQAGMAAAVKIGCLWCVDFGYWVLHGHGIPREKIEPVSHWRDSDLFDPLERLVMEYAEAITQTPPTVWHSRSVGLATALRRRRRGVPPTVRAGSRARRGAAEPDVFRLAIWIDCRRGRRKRRSWQIPPRPNTTRLEPLRPIRALLAS